MRNSVIEPRSKRRQSIALAGQALRMWTARQVLIATGGAIAVALIIGIATVLIPNPIFGRDIPPVWWNYPVWLLTSALSGVLLATYIRPSSADPSEAQKEPSSVDDTAGRRSSRMGITGGILAWFAVGCPVCNKLALLALGYSGAIAWFAPIQPFLAVGAMVLTAVAVVWRLQGQIACRIKPQVAALS